MKERAALSDRLRSFGPVTSREAVAKCLSDERGLVARTRGLKGCGKTQLMPKTWLEVSVRC